MPPNAAFCNAPPAGPMGEGIAAPGSDAGSRPPIPGMPPPFGELGPAETAAIEQEMMNSLPLIPPPPPISSATVTNDQVIFFSDKTKVAQSRRAF